MGDMVDAFVAAESAIREHTGCDPYWLGLCDERESWWTVDGTALMYSVHKESIEKYLSTDGEYEGDEAHLMYGGECRATHDGSDGVFRGVEFVVVPYDTQQGFDSSPIFRADREVRR